MYQLHAYATAFHLVMIVSKCLSLSFGFTASL
jgi:hypothetical protein